MKLRRPNPRPDAPRPATRAAHLARVGLLSVLVVLALGAGMIWAAYRTLGRDLPPLAELERTRPVGGTIVFGVRGDTLQSYYREKRVNIDLEEVPRHLKTAVLSVEDWRFYRHWGLDLWGLVRATAANLRRRGVTQGASTLTQQLARNLFLSHEQTVTRKIKEAMLALRIERTYTKDEIFRMYLNQIYFGEGAYGAEAAARTYFDKAAHDLDLLESATLAGLPKNPNNYSPLDHPDRALRRRNVVLLTMLDHALIDRAQYDSLTSRPLVVRPGREADPAAAYFTEEVRKYLESRYGAAQLYGGELRVYTTLDLGLQRSAERALESRYHDLEENQSAPDRRSLYLAARARGEEPEPKYLQGAVVALQPRSGRVLAMVGGRSFRESRFNRATQARRQPGSCFKPFVYAAAVQQGVAPADIIIDTPLVLDMGGGRGLWKPQNYSKTFNGPVSVRYALAKSLNIPAIKTLQRLGPDRVIDTAHKMGVTSPLEPVLSLALGTSEVTLLELVGAFATLANGGVTSRPYFIERIEGRGGRILERAEEFHQEALDPQTAFIVTHMLESALDWGTGHNARDLYGLTQAAAGKTGTTDDLGDGWFVGYTPDLVVGVWGGYDDRRPIGFAGAYIALPPWCDILREYSATHPGRSFVTPAGSVVESVCTDSGKMATPHCPKVESELFTERTRPTRECDLHSTTVMDTGSEGGLGALRDASMQSKDLEPPTTPRPDDPHPQR